MLLYFVIISLIYKSARVDLLDIIYLYSFICVNIFLKLIMLNNILINIIIFIKLR